MNLIRSLQARYMVIILSAVFLLFILQLFSAALGTFLMDTAEESDDRKRSAKVIESHWHKEVHALQNISTDSVEQHFAKWQEAYPEASMFWVDGQGELTEQQVNVNETLPSTWTSAYTAKFLKDHYNGNPFTVVSFLGDDESNGFAVFEIPRSVLEPPLIKVYDQYSNIFFFGSVIFILVFITISYLFFRGIRKRLLHLQEAMTLRDTDHLPLKISVKKEDEIGQLEQSFNHMVHELRESKQREQEEEQLRRELIANLSHDLRTPLTKISAQTYSIGKEKLSPSASQAVNVLTKSVEEVDKLIENLMSYTLLAASKFKFEQKEIHVVRFVREHLASWYPVFEKEQFKIEIDLNSFDRTTWKVDPIWLGSILDNLLQNVFRHASSGRYLKVQTASTDQYDSIIIVDRGKGWKHASKEKGAGIGLSIVDMMVKGMQLEWDITSNTDGATIIIQNPK
ncbi:HAMP domain-containing sensor histidine kinase [Terribacillus sp. DMT04]|uniref:sensor histidine kinase n=1 Tax=Terribacillus sp. DMT04 TaxID=2850441 RepID=UPI001C2B8981|nr:HAMP domain-containing sensor histidine kinase [Terribacillus sp. DMT04]QXE01001.1 HAMP domain-containing histidine kinase [Terribacillus sp. DMT04]